MEQLASMVMAAMRVDEEVLSGKDLGSAVESAAPT